MLLREPQQERQEIVAVNDLLQEVSLSYAIEDITSSTIIASGEKVLTANDTFVLGDIPVEPKRQTLYRITWKARNEAGVNHYLAGSPPFDLKQYRHRLNAACSL